MNITSFQKFCVSLGAVFIAGTRPFKEGDMVRTVVGGFFGQISSKVTGACIYYVRVVSGDGRLVYMENVLSHELRAADKEAK